LTVDVHEIDGGGFYGEVRQLPGCLAQADTLEDLAEAIREAVRDYFAEPGLLTEQTAQGLAAIQGTAAIPPGPYPLRRDYQPPPSWTEAHEDE
jgi:predicted RNase H-like HicB family nuclease